MLPAIPRQPCRRSVLPPRYDPLWAACVETGLPVHQHQGTGVARRRHRSGRHHHLLHRARAVDQAHAAPPRRRRRVRTPSRAAGGVDRDVGPALGGRGAGADDAAAAQRAVAATRADPRSLNYSQTFGSPVVDGLSLTPLEYFRRNCSIGASMLPRHDVKYCRVLGVDRIMWGTDCAASRRARRRTRPRRCAPRLFDVPERRLRAMLGEQRGAALRLRPRRASAPIAAAVGPTVAEVAEPLADVPALPGVAFAPEDPLEAAAGLSSPGTRRRRPVAFRCMPNYDKLYINGSWVAPAGDRDARRDRLDHRGGLRHHPRRHARRHRPGGRRGQGGVPGVVGDVGARARRSCCCGSPRSSRPDATRSPT